MRERAIGCLKLQVIFRKRATNCRALLWKITCTDKASYEVEVESAHTRANKQKRESSRKCENEYVPERVSAKRRER